MELNAMAAVFIFVVAYILIISEKVHRTVVAMSAAVVLILLGIVSQENAIHHIDFNTLGLLIGMMVIVNITSETGLFNYLAIWSAKCVKAKPVYLLAALGALTAVCSAFLDNVTTVLLTVPVTFSIASQLKISPKPFLVAQIIASNIGGTATLIGDPPNIMISSAVKELDFMAFLWNLAPICILLFIVSIFVLAWYYKDELKTTVQLQEKIMQLNEKKQIQDAGLLKKCLFVLFLTILGFILQRFLHLETASAALAGASLLLLLTIGDDEVKLSKLFAKVEWTAVFFFIGLFILVGALVEKNVISLLASEAMQFTQGNVLSTTMLILWLSAITSAVIDNIPFVATMIPFIKDLGSLGGIQDLTPLWWALSLGACLGGNGTLIGASANVVVASMAAQHGQQISFLRYLKIALPLTLLAIAISSVYIYCRYL